MLRQFADINSQPSPLADAMKYGLLLGGKRIRLFLVYATGKMLGLIKSNWIMWRQ